MIDPKNSLTWTSMVVSKAHATNNAASPGVDLKGYQGPIHVRVNLGIKTAGDNDGAVTVILQHAANNTASEATNLSVGNVATTNNTAASGGLVVDPRETHRYLFARVILAGTNSPSYPISIEVAGKKQHG